MPSKKFSGKGVRHAGTPVLRRKKRLRPRGKPFERGNTCGVRTRFVKGKSGNPGGCPKYKKISEACRAIVAKGLNEVIVIESYADALALRWLKEALKGNISAGRELADRGEGKPAQSLFVDGNDNPISILIASMDARSDQVGLAEGRERQLTQGEDGNGPGEEGRAG